MIEGVNRQIVLAARPNGMPRLTDFAVIDASIPQVDSGAFLIASEFLSADPLQRWRMNESAQYGRTIGLGEVVWGRIVGRVVRSRHPDWREGDLAEGMLGWQSYATSRGETARAAYAPGVTRVDPSLGPPSTALGILGMPGVTAYFALGEIIAPRAGETIVVSAAAGTVGSLAGQLAKVAGCRVVGIAGGPAKVRHVVEDLGFDAAIDHRDAEALPEALRAACPDGVDGYFDNVGGSIADAVCQLLRPRARVALVGRVAQLAGAAARRDFQERFISSRVRLEGFIVYDYADRAHEARAAIAALLRAGRVRYRETVHEGIESAPQALIDVLCGNGLGKHVVRVRSIGR